MENFSFNILFSLSEIEDKTSLFGIERSCLVSTKLKMYRTDVSQNFPPLFTKVIQLVKVMVSEVSNLETSA